MTPSTAGASARLKARTAGLLYLGCIVTGVLALSIRSALIVSGDAAATSAHLLASEPLFRFAFVTELVGMGCYVGVTAILYDLLKPVGRTTSLVAAFFSLIGCALGAASGASLLAPFILLGDAPYLAAFSPQQLQAMTMAALRLHGQVFNIGMVNFGVYCTLIGILIYRSGFMPRIIGALMVFGGLGWLFDTVSTFLAPTFSLALGSWTMLPGSLGEGALALWLFFVGLNAPKWESRAGAAEALLA